MPGAPNVKMDLSDPYNMDAATPALREGPRCLFSILIGPVSTEDSSRIFETLDALRAQEGSPAYEVIIADRRLDPVPELFRANYQEASVLPCAAGPSSPEPRPLA